MDVLNHFMKKYRSYKRFRESEEYATLSMEQLRKMHEAFEQNPELTKEQKQFKRVFYRRESDRLGLNVYKQISDQRHRPPTMHRPLTFYVIMRTMLAVGIFSGCAWRICDSFVEVFNMPVEPESVRSKLYTAIEVDDELARMLRQMMREESGI